MKTFCFWLGALYFSLLFSPLSFADNIRPVMVYDTNVIMDKSWSEAIHNGIVRFEGKTGIDVEETSIIDIPSFAEKVTKFVENGYNPIMLNNVGKGKDVILKEILHKYPKTRFIVFNGIFNIPNAYYFVFSYHESSFLAGYLASRKSKTNKLGFVGGMDIPIIRNFLCGYINGAHYQNPDIEIEWDFIGKEISAWSKPEDAYKLALNQINSGADVIYTPSGGSSVGALKAAHEQGGLGIGVDSNQNYLYPGSVLTTALVNVDVVAFRALLAAHRNIWGDQFKVMGLQENGVGLAYDEYNAPLISPELRKEVDSVKEKLILKEIQIDNYVNVKQCIVNGEILF